MSLGEYTDNAMQTHLKAARGTVDASWCRRVVVDRIVSPSGPVVQPPEGEETIITV
jgi:hypothetical protein